MRRPTIKDVAEHAKVSLKTVSRVINHNGRFSKATEQRVLQVIQQNEYVPNMSAKGLRTSRTEVIGVMVPDITNLVAAYSAEMAELLALDPETAS